MIRSRPSTRLRWAQRCLNLTVLGVLSTNPCDATNYFIAPPPLGSSGGSGLDWANASSDLAGKMSAALPGDNLFVIENSLFQTVPGSTLGFSLPAGVGLYGGFAGTELNLPPLGNPQTTVLDGLSTAHHVISVGPASASSGLTTIGYLKIANGNCLAVSNGAGITVSGGSLLLTNCFLFQNQANNGGAIWSSGTALSMKNCTFWHNFANFNGAALWGSRISGRIDNCTFKENGAESNGGAVYLQSIASTYEVMPPYDPSPNVKFVNCLLRDNESNTGGAAYLAGGSTTSGKASWINCSFVENSSRDGLDGLTIHADDTQNVDAVSVMRNSVVWATLVPAVRHLGGGQHLVRYSDIRDTIPNSGWSGVSSNNKINADPLLSASYAPQLGSALLECANSSFLPLDVLDIDEDGNTTEVLPIDLRLMGGSPGQQSRAWDDPATVNTGTGTVAGVPVTYLDMGAIEYH